MTQSTDLQSISMKVGELVGRVGEVVHSVNNMSQKLDAVAMQVAEAKNLPADVAALDVRVSALEADRHRRDGAMGFGGWLLKMLPISAISAVISAAIAVLAGKHP